MRLIQYIDQNGKRRVGAIPADDGKAYAVREADSVRMLALRAHRARQGLQEFVHAQGLEEAIDYDMLLTEKRVLPPLDHEDPAHCIISLTGLTHLGSAASRNAMHARLSDPNPSDSMKMFKLGLEGGKPQSGQPGVQPEWAYKGDGDWIVPPEQPISMPPFAIDGGEEAEIAGLYVIGDEGEILRVGYAIGNEFADHAMERQNYLYLAHSKLRHCAFGPELRIGALPASVQGRVRILRDGKTAWEDTVLSGEDNMCHSIENLEQHHFKYAGFRRPGDVHVHFFGASTLSCGAGIATRDGDIFEIEMAGFGRALRNPLQMQKQFSAIEVRQL